MIRIIPAIDIMDGRAVRLAGGDFSKRTVYYNDPLEAAKMFEDAGLKNLHMVDLDGARAGATCNWKTLERIASGTSLQIDFGGGIQSMEDVSRVFNAGAAQVNAGTIPARNKELFLSWMKMFGAEKFLVGADVKGRSLMVKGWEEDSGQEVSGFINDYMLEGVGNFFCTDVSKDGMMEGPAIDLYKSLLTECAGMELIASGGVKSIEDVEALDDCGCKGVIIGKALYEGGISLKKLKRYVD